MTENVCVMSTWSWRGERAKCMIAKKSGASFLLLLLLFIPVMISIINSHYQADSYVPSSPPPQYAFFLLDGKKEASILAF